MLCFHRNKMEQSETCPAMFHKIDEIAWDWQCNRKGKEDFLRRVPCPAGQLCLDEDVPDHVMPGYQFTYAVQDTTRPRYVPHMHTQTHKYRQIKIIF